MNWDQYNGYNSGDHKKEQRYIYANGKEIAERRIYAGAMHPYTRDTTVLKVSDASGVDKLETILHGSGYPAINLSLDPFGADTGSSSSDTYPAPPPSGYPDPNDPNCTWNDYDDYDCDYPEEYDGPENEDQQAGGIPENTCYVDGREADCNEVAVHPDIYESDDVALGDEEYKEEKAPSDEGPQGIWDDDDQGSQPTETEERYFEADPLNAKLSAT